MNFRKLLLKSADASIGAGLCLGFGLWDHWDRRQPGMPVSLPDPIRRILLIRPGGLGDMVMLLPAIKSLQSAMPGVPIDVLCESRNADVLTFACPDVEQLVYDRSPLAVLRELHGRDYDVVIDTEQFHHFSAIFARTAGAPARIGFRINPRRNLLYTHLVTYAMDGYECEQFGRLAHVVAGQDSSGLAGVLRDCSLPDDETVSRRLDALGRFAVVHVGAGSVYKQWPCERFADLMRRLADEHDLAAVLVGNPSDASRADRVVRMCSNMADRVHSFAGSLDLPGVASVLRKADLFIGADSGIGHLAVALDTRSVILFGPSDERKWGHAATRHRIVRVPLSCSPCCMFGYHKLCRTVACMDRLSADRVMGVCRDVLTTKGP